MTRIQVESERGRYPIVIDPGLRHRLGGCLREAIEGDRVGLVTNSKIDRLYGAPVRQSLVASGFRPVTLRVPDGERYKTLEQVSRIYDALVRHRFERGSTLIALGGGVIGDMAGFAAATYLRGIACVQVPTTVVAQVDASIGGKTGVDHPKGKNLIGAFHAPKMVCIDPEVLTTLSKREFVAGLAEVVKYGVIADARFFSELERHADALVRREAGVVSACIKRAAEMKAEVVSADERESGLRKILNYGHTLGHAIETLTGYRACRHGEAVAIGMMFAARLSCHLGGMPQGEVERQAGLLARLGLPTQIPKGLKPGALLKVMLQDKKVSAGEVYFVLPEKIGSTRVEKVNRNLLESFLTRSVR